MKCEKCGADIPAGAKTCPKCNAAAPQNTVPQNKNVNTTDKNKSASAGMTGAIPLTSTLCMSVTRTQHISKLRKTGRATRCLRTKCATQ